MTVTPKPEAGIAPFLALDIRVGRVEHAEPFPEARRPAHKLWVDFGPQIGTLQTSAQIVNYDPADLIGRTVVGVVNLGAKRIAGFTSQFLILGGLEADGTVHLLRPDIDLPAGSVVA